MDAAPAAITTALFLGMAFALTCAEAVEAGGNADDEESAAEADDEDAAYEIDKYANALRPSGFESPRHQLQARMRTDY